jgi:hypothetical protein
MLNIDPSKSPYLFKDKIEEKTINETKIDDELYNKINIMEVELTYNSDSGEKTYTIYSNKFFNLGRISEDITIKLDPEFTYRNYGTPDTLFNNYMFQFELGVPNISIRITPSDSAKLYYINGEAPDMTNVGAIYQFSIVNNCVIYNIFMPITN